MSTPRTPKIIFGAGGIGHTERSFTFTWETPEAVSSLLSTLKRLDILELDSAASYPPSNPWHTETLLGQAEAIKKGFVIDSKILNTDRLSKENVASSIDKTLRLLGTPQVRTLYAHEPDPSTPLEETATALNAQLVAGKFQRLGLSNYSPEQIVEYFSICDSKGFVRPTIYQGHYNALIRGHEEKLIPLLRKHGLKYYAFSPLGGGFLTGKVTFAEDRAASLARTRFSGDSTQNYYVGTFDRPEAHEALQELNKVCQEHGVSLAEVSLRWLNYHSALGGEDAIILGAKRVEQLESNVANLRKGPLPQALVDAVESMSSGGFFHEGSWR